jgi:hypothetical protein
VNPGEIGHGKSLNNLFDGVGESLPSEVGFIAMKKEEWDSGFISNKIDTQKCGLIRGKVIFFEEHRRPSRPVIQEFVVVKDHDKFGVKLVQDVMSHLLNDLSGIGESVDTSDHSKTGRNFNFMIYDAK